MVLKLAGVLAVVKYIGYIPMIVASLAGSFMIKGNTLNFFIPAMYLLGSLIYPAGCVLLIIYSDKIAAKLFQEDKMVQISTSMSKDEIMLIAFTCIGLWVIAGAIPELINIATTYIMTIGAGDMSRRALQMGHTTRFIAAIVKLAIGCWCFLGAKRIVGLWHKIRGNVDLEEYKS